MAEINFLKCTQKNQSAAASSKRSSDNLTKISKISTIFFDLDNTLIPTKAGDSKTCRKLAEVLENQFKFTKDEATLVTQVFLKSFRRCPDNSQTSLDSWRTYLWREALPPRHKELAEQIYTKWLQLRYRYLALPVEFLQMLRKFRDTKYLLALITNGPSNAQWEKIQKLNLSDYFDCILVSSDLPWEKPNPNIFYAACNFLFVKPEQCAMIGDKLETDIKGGCLANLGATFWLPLNSAETDLTDVSHPPDFILRNLSELCKYFPALGTNGTAINANTSNNFLTKRRGSQISCNVTSTCDNSDLRQRHQQLQQRHYQHQTYNQIPIPKNKYRRGGSLPTIDCFNSETENSSDSLFN